MDPFTILAISSTALGAVGAVQAGNAQAANYGMQANAAQHNARLSGMQAKQARDAGLQNELAQRSDNARQQGALAAAIGESGFDSASGTALAVQKQAAQDMELAALSERYGALLAGYGSDQQAGMDRYSAKVARKSGRNARAGGYMGAASNLLGGAANIYGKKADLKRFEK